MPALTLMLLRHAKSAWPDGVADHDRPLGPRGAKAAPLMGAYMARAGLLPALALVSTARRTQQTWAKLAPFLPADTERRDVAAIYEAPAATLLDVVRGVEGARAPLLLVGHNPGFQDLALLLAGEDGGADRARLAAKFPTGALAVIDVEGTGWAEVAPGSGRLRQFVTPRSLDENGRNR
ncbi:histidine phosphatase family protein [Rhizobium sp. TRM95111]|uniref:SixA phosphatase family protein n=1 Tax=Rhizobium alarense TaxID=2846851 RepID=UPI001F297C8C|nr:histidine phosphatase family protein [Rhizobium alarense]MCF3641295.1 histidine phosphatase family protein [Rhizobium alarense]